MNGNRDNLPSHGKLIVGTVQFGIPYGISNSQGQVSHQEGTRILALARQSGIRLLDTAIAYGDSETVLGDLNVTDLQVITKLPEMPALPHATDVTTWVEKQVNGSLSRLRVPSLHGLLLHRPAQLRSAEGPALYRALLAQRECGRVARIGISIYGPDELDQLPDWMKFDIVQGPLSVVDARMIRSGWAERLQQAGCEFHARSIFLQGLLLMPPEARPPAFDRWNDLWRLWDSWLAETQLAPLEACVRHALATPQVSRLVIGVESAAQLAAILSSFGSRIPPLPDGLASTDPALLNPSLWKTT